MVYTAKEIWAQKWKLLPVAKIKEKRKKVCHWWSAYMTDYISAHISQMAFMGLDFETDKPRMKPEL